MTTTRSAGALLLFAALLVPLGGCRSTYYSAMEAIGVHKRDILVDRVEEGREAQQAAQEQFRTTLEVFQELTGFDGGSLERLYKDLSREYERSEKRAAAVSERIDSIETVAGDLMREWRRELEEMESADLRARSEAMLAETEERSETLIAKMREAEARMVPVLAAFRDHVLFLKHSLNAQAVDALRGTAGEIEADVEALVREMQESIEAADAFIEAMG